jgi:hypothetical protein
MAQKRDGDGTILTVFAFLYTGLLMVALALTAYKELLNSSYIWFIFTSVPLPVLTVLAEGDGVLPVVFFAGICGLLDLVNFIMILVNWIQQGSFYLGLGAVDGGWFGLWVLILDLVAFMATTGLIIYFLLKSRSKASKYL